MGARIVLLGRLAIERGDAHVAGRSAALSGRRSEVVFAFLAADHRRSVSREELADEVWPETLPETWTCTSRSRATRCSRTARELFAIPAIEIGLRRADRDRRDLAPGRGDRLLAAERARAAAARRRQSGRARVRNRRRGRAVAPRSRSTSCIRTAASSTSATSTSSRGSTTPRSGPGASAARGRGGRVLARRRNAARHPVRRRRALDDYLRAIGMASGGAVRVSLGVATNFADVYRFIHMGDRVRGPHRRSDRSSAEGRVLVTRKPAALLRQLGAKAVMCRAFSMPEEGLEPPTRGL
jgi:hypothetical protein